MIRLWFAFHILSFSKCIFRTDLTSWNAVLLLSRKEARTAPQYYKRECHLQNLADRGWTSGSNETLHSFLLVSPSGGEGGGEDCHFPHEICDYQSRPRCLLRCFGASGLWPITFAIEASISNFQNAVNNLLLPFGRSLFHTCLDGAVCPLLQEFVHIQVST